VELLPLLIILLSPVKFLFAGSSLVLLLLEEHHLVSYFNPVLLPLLIPAPFIHLRLTQAGRAGDVLDNLFSPNFVLLEAVIQHLKLLIIFAWTLGDLTVIVGVQEHLPTRKSLAAVDVGTG
jgi:hypothetical protein